MRVHIFFFFFFFFETEETRMGPENQKLCECDLEATDDADPLETNNQMSTPEHKSLTDAAAASSCKADQSVYRLPRIIQLCQRYQFNREETEIFHLMVVSQVSDENVFFFLRRTHLYTRPDMPCKEEQNLQHNKRCRAQDEF